MTDPDSRLIHDKRMSKLQGYNAQAAVSCYGQIILAAELSARSPDFGQLAPMRDAAIRDPLGSRSRRRGGRGHDHGLARRFSEQGLRDAVAVAV